MKSQNNMNHVVTELSNTSTRDNSFDNGSIESMSRIRAKNQKKVKTYKKDLSEIRDMESNIEDESSSDIDSSEEKESYQDSKSDQQSDHDSDESFRETYGNIDQKFRWGFQTKLNTANAKKLPEEKKKEDHGDVLEI